MSTPKGTILVISQVYVPDPTSVGQHMADAAAALVARGWRVVCFTSANGYDDPTQKYPRRETLNGVDVRRMPLSSFGKGSIKARLAGQMLFLLQCFVHGLFVGGVKAVFVSTSPPMTSMAAVPLSILKGARLKWWAMDINPDQMVELGKMRAGSPAVRFFDFLNRLILRRASDIVALDRFMAARLNKKVDVSDKMTLMPPWPHDDHLEVVPHEGNPFRREHDLDGKFVIMYSGNHGFSTPVKTVLDAAVRLKDRKDIVFMFIGGGVGKQDVRATIENENPGNIIDLPYQPLDRIKYSLSAADVHLVSVGDDVVGVVHPCKVYGAMTVARPILLLGPDPCHVSDLVRDNDIGWQITHGDVDGAVRVIEEIVATPRERLAEMGDRAREIITRELCKDVLCGRFCDVIERGLVPETAAATGPATGASKGAA